MANNTELKNAIAQVIKTNGNQEITGQVLQNTLNSIISSIGSNATFAGIAIPTTSPGTPDQNVFYFAVQAGTYVNFGGLEIKGGFNIIKNNTSGNWVLSNVYELVEELGDSETAVISQKAVTTELVQLRSGLNDVAQIPIKQVGYWSNVLNRYIAGSGESMFIPCSVYEKIFIKAQSGSGAPTSEYAYVKDFKSSGVTFVDGVTGMTTMNVGASSNTTVPEGANYLMLLSKSSRDVNRLPSVVIGDGQRNLYKGFIEDMIPTRLVPNAVYASGLAYNGNDSVLSWTLIQILMPDASVVDIAPDSITFSGNGVLVYRYTTDSLKVLSAVSQVEAGDVVLLQKRNAQFVGGLLYPYLNSTRAFIVAANNLQFNGGNVSWGNLDILNNDGSVTSISANSHTMSVSNPILVYNIFSRTIGTRMSLSGVIAGDALLLYYRNGKFVNGELLGYQQKSGYPVIVAANNVSFSNNNLSWSSLSIKLNDGSVVDLLESNYNMGVSSPILVYRKSTNSVVTVGAFSGLKEEDVLLAYYRIDYGIIGGELAPYIQKDDIQNEYNKDDINLNITRRIRQLQNVKWTPLSIVYAGEGTHEAGAEVTGIPYSSVKEYLKFVGIDVSLHTFMTTIHDPHSMMYTEGPMTNNSRSAYGITYNGVNSHCYFGNVCSALVTTALGRKVQDNSWEYKTLFERYHVLKNQNVENFRVGDILSKNGHCSIISNIVRNYDGSIARVYISEQAAPIRTSILNIPQLKYRMFSEEEKACRYDFLELDTDYTPSTFALEKNENLYRQDDLMFIDGIDSRTFYKCSSPNRDAEFTASKWSAVKPFKSENLPFYIGTYASIDEKIYRAKVRVDSATFNPSDWVEVHGVFEWAAYPYVYNDDIITFVGDRAAFRTNDLIYINYQKGSYTKMQIFKDGLLIQTLNLSSENSVYQVNVSSYCSAAGMYKARLTNDTNYSRYTYFEVIDTTFSVTYQNGVADIRFSSSNGKPLEFQITEQSGYPIARDAFTEKELSAGNILVNPMALLYVLRHVYWGRYDEYYPKMYARVVYSGEYGNVVNAMEEIGIVEAFEGEIIYPDKPNDLGTIGGNNNIILSERTADNSYSFSFVADASVSVSIIPAIGNVVWTESLPTYTQGKTYLFQIVNGIGKCIEV